ncbi:MAG: DUF554 domain-containing protein [Atribacterota bacterium]|jgi:uncharacterized membrane protein YqgA involved in biofilm formation|nr:DUF554 domain-containing protein [Atribacterota bacterium]MDD5497427.1 DUF554 domain-containing protein [Atribacterota bacterium]
MFGTIVNSLAIISGCIIGMILKGHFPKRISAILFQGIGLVTLVIGMQMAIKAQEIILIILSVVFGGIIGEVIDIEKRLDRWGEKIKLIFKQQKGKEKFTEGFITASLLYCVGSMAVMGAIEEGINGNPDILLAKSALDGISSIIFTASFGIGVLFSTIPVFLYQGTITQVAILVKNWITVDMINEMTAVGGILILGLALGILEIKKLKIANLLPSLLIVLLLTAIKK